MKKILAIIVAYFSIITAVHAIPSLNGLPAGAKQSGYELFFDSWESFYNWEYDHCLAYPLARDLSGFAEQFAFRKSVCEEWKKVRQKESPMFFSSDASAREIKDKCVEFKKTTGQTCKGFYRTNKYQGYCPDSEDGDIDAARIGISGVSANVSFSQKGDSFQSSKVVLYVKCSPSTPSTPPPSVGHLTCALDADVNVLLRPYVQLVSPPLSANYTAADWNGPGKLFPNAAWKQGNGQGDFPVSQTGKHSQGSLDLELNALGNRTGVLSASARYTSNNGNFSKIRDTLCASPNAVKKLCDAPRNSPEKGRSYYQISVNGFKPVVAEVSWGTEKGGWFSSKNKAWENIELRGSGAKQFDFPDNCPKLSNAQSPLSTPPSHPIEQASSPREQLISSIVQMHQQVLALYDDYKIHPTEEKKQKLRATLKQLDSSIGKYKKNYQMDKRVYDSEAVPADMLKAVDYR